MSLLRCSTSELNFGRYEKRFQSLLLSREQLDFSFCGRSSGFVRSVDVICLDVLQSRCINLFLVTSHLKLQVKAGSLFDNILITDDEAYAKKAAEETWAQIVEVSHYTVIIVTSITPTTAMDMSGPQHAAVLSPFVFRSCLSHHQPNDMVAQMCTVTLGVCRGKRSRSKIQRGGESQMKRY